MMARPFPSCPFIPHLFFFLLTLPLNAGEETNQKWTHPKAQLRPSSERLLHQSTGQEQKISSAHLEDVISSYRASHPEVKLSEEALKAFREIEEGYKEILSGKSSGNLELDQLEKDKQDLLQMFDQIINLEQGSEKAVSFDVATLIRNQSVFAINDDIRPGLKTSLEVQEAREEEKPIDLGSLKAVAKLSTKESEKEYYNSNSSFPNMTTSSRYNPVNLTDLPSIKSMFQGVNPLDYNMKTDFGSYAIQKNLNPAVVGQLNKSSNPEKEAASMLSKESKSVLDLLPETVKPQTVAHPIMYQQAASYLPGSKGTPSLVTPTNPSGSPSLLDIISENEANILAALGNFMSSPPAQSVSTDPVASPANYISYLNSMVTFKPTVVASPSDSQLPTSNSVISANDNSGITPEAFANLLNQLQLTNVVKSVSNLTKQTTELNTRLTPELTSAISELITNLSDAITTFLDDLQTAITDNPLLGVLLALGLLALLWHFFPYDFQKKKKKGYGHDHHGGYHKRDWELEFRSMGDFGQDFTSDILTKIASFEKWLDSIDHLDPETVRFNGKT